MERVEAEAVQAVMRVLAHHAPELPDESIWKDRFLRCYSDLLIQTRREGWEDPQAFERDAHEEIRRLTEGGR
jgi:hypothetical protein